MKKKEVRHTKKKEMKPQPKKETKQKEVVKDPDAKISVVLSRGQIHLIRKKLNNADPDLDWMFGKILTRIDSTAEAIAVARFGDATMV